MNKKERERQKFDLLVRTTAKKLDKLAKLSAKDFPNGYPSMDGVWEMRDVDLDILPPMPEPFAEYIIDEAI